MARWFAVIAGVILGIGLVTILFDIKQHASNRDSIGTRVFNTQVAIISSELKLYKKTYGHYPSNDEGLEPIASGAKHKMEKDRSYCSHCRLMPSGILTWWGDPIIYENRHGRSSSDFDWSGASNNRDYSYRVDDGIYLWSVGAKSASYRLKVKYRRHIAIGLITLISLVALLTAYVSAAMKKLCSPPWYIRILSLIWFGASGLFVALVVSLPFSIFVPGCGCPGFQIPRTPETNRAYITIMRNYRRHGIISDDTLHTTLRHLKEDEKNRDYYRPI